MTIELLLMSKNGLHLNVSRRNKQDQLEALVYFQRYAVSGLRETWWKESHDWKAGMQGWRCSGGIGRASKVEEMYCV